jgi:hypothetical protein
MAITERQRTFDRGTADVALHAKRAEPKPRQADALGFDIFHKSLLKAFTVTAERTARDVA